MNDPLKKEQSEKPDVDVDDYNPKSVDDRPGRDRLMERMKKVDPKQSEKYKQRTGE